MKKELTPEQALLKVEQYCAYQERCRSEVLLKLHSFGITGIVAENILEHLEEAGFLDEQRFARTFAGSKFRQLKWGRVRIRLEMKKKRIPERLIEQGLEEIGNDAYRDTILQLYQQKIRSLPGEHPDQRQKAIHYLLQKGYELEEILEITGRKC